MEDNLSSRTTTNLAEVVGRNQDLLTEILNRVPAKALLKFKCVSKQWLSLISDAKFCLSHTLHLFTHNPTPAALLLNNSYTSTPEFQIVPLKDNPKVPYLDYLNVPRIKILQSCNGLLLCSSTYLRNPDDQGWKRFMSEEVFKSDNDYSSSVVCDDDKGVKYFVCNPTTKQFKMIRYPRIKGGFLPTCFYLAFDPLKSPHYKVFSERLVGNGIFDIDIYFSETDSWNFKRYSFSIVSFLGSSTGVFLNGAIHWFCFEKESQYFDVDSETMKTYPMPPLDAGEMVNYFGESQGHLHLGVTNDYLDLEFDIWELESDYSGWFVKYHVNLQSMKMEFPELVWDHGPRESPFRILSLIRAQTEEESTLVLFVDRKAICYSIFYGTSNKLCDLQLKPKPRSSLYGYSLDYDKDDAFEYIETLVRL